jgi:hypothetical protein
MASVVADFAAADDLLREAGQGRLAGHASIVLQKSGRIGPLVEIALWKREGDALGVHAHRHDHRK